MSNSPTKSFLVRLDKVEQRLMQDHHLRTGALTIPDPQTGEQWDAGQIWAHLAEILSYWLEQTTLVIDAHSSQPVPFGRVKSNTERINAIARDRHVAQEILRERLRTNIVALRTFLLERDEADWLAQGKHQARGVMDLESIVDDFLVGHLEEHADQLDSLRIDAQEKR